MTAARGAWALLLVAGCTARQPGLHAARDTHDAMGLLAGCTFGAASATPRDAVAVEAGLRRAVREDRMAFAVRAGRCASVLDPALRQRDASARALGDAWDALLPLAQSAAPDDIALEQAIRHVGNAWRDAAR